MSESAHAALLMIRMAQLLSPLESGPPSWLGCTRKNRTLNFFSTRKGSSGNFKVTLPTGGTLPYKRVDRLTTKNREKTPGSLTSTYP